MFKPTFLLLFLLTVVFQSCTISGEQEEQLNRQLGKYIAAHNNHQLLELIGLSHPDAVRYYKNQGDSTFIEHFKDYREGQKTYLANPIYRETKSSGKNIQRLYWAEYYTNEAEINHEYRIFAVSDDGGDNWFFLREDDYKNKEIRGFTRLFD